MEQRRTLCQRNRSASAVRVAIGIGALVVTLAACGGETTDGAGGATTTGSVAKTPVTVFAAASLQKAFTAIAAQEPDLDVTFSYDGSSALVDALRQGAPADVLATADDATMASARRDGLLAGEPQVFARNELTLITPHGNPAHITGLDGSLQGHRLVVCAPAVPCGAAAATLARAAGVTLHPVSEESKVTDVRGKVESGEADAGLVYVTDARVSGSKVDTIPLAGAGAALNADPIAVVKGAPHSEAAARFVAAVRSERGRRVLADLGFRPAS